MGVGKPCTPGEEGETGANPAQCPLCSGLQALGQTFGANPAFASSLRYLDLSKNPGLLATDESNVSPRNTAQAPAEARSGRRARVSITPSPCNPAAPLPRPSTASWPSPTLWCTWTWRGLTAPLTW